MKAVQDTRTPTQAANASVPACHSGPGERCCNGAGAARPDFDDSTSVAILAMHPIVAQLEEARIWLVNVLSKAHRPLEGAQIVDLLKVYEHEPPRGGARIGLRLRRVKSANREVEDRT